MWERKHYLTTHNRINCRYERLSVKNNLKIKVLRKHGRTMNLKSKNSSAPPKKNKRGGGQKHKQAIHKYTRMFHSIIYSTEKILQISSISI